MSPTKDERIGWSPQPESNCGFHANQGVRASSPDRETEADGDLEVVLSAGLLAQVGALEPSAMAGRTSIVTLRGSPFAAVAEASLSIEA
ncbi:MAG TPA: hypothetical protein VMN37_06770 [Gemmatimonadales bacterium]|nr:hypothetical protein [Gemmatimonadales bacterium]